MSKARQHPLLVFLIHMTQCILLRQIAYLKAENQILRSRLPKQIRTTVAERSLLVRLGAPLGDAIQELLSIVSYKSFLRWKNEQRPSAGAQKPVAPNGRPRSLKAWENWLCVLQKRTPGDIPGSRENSASLGSLWRATRLRRSLSRMAFILIPGSWLGAGRSFLSATWTRCGPVIFS